MSKKAPTVVNGWAIYAHPLFLDQVETLVKQVRELREKDPTGYQKKKVTKRLFTTLKLAFDVIPQNPASPTYRQGRTLGDKYKHWFRAKFSQQYRLFFRYHDDGEQKVIVLAWVNDEKTKRAYESKSDAYRVFEKMLDNGNPPDDWSALLEASQIESEQLRELLEQL